MCKEVLSLVVHLQPETGKGPYIVKDVMPGAGTQKEAPQSAKLRQIFGPDIQHNEEPYETDLPHL